MTVYQLRLPAFEGPLDLLLQLVERRQLDISIVSLAEVTEQYLEHLASLEPLDLDAWSGFLVVAARLLLLKSRSLLPRPPLESEERVGDGTGDLVQQLVEYRRFRPLIAFLREREDAGLRSYPRLAPPPAPAPPALLPGTPADLLAAYHRSLARREPPPIVVRPATISIAEQIERIGRALATGRPFSFRDLLAEVPGRASAVAGFLAILELIRRGSVDVDQANLFGEILLRPTGDPPSDA